MGGSGLIRMAQDMNQWMSFVNTEMLKMLRMGSFTFLLNT
jgi:hypothetical protein